MASAKEYYLRPLTAAVIEENGDKAMRKSIYILLGLLMVGGAAGSAYFLNIAVQKSSRQESNQHTARGPQPTTRGMPSPSDQRTQSASKPAPSRFQMFDTIVNILNVVVGLVGIYLSIAGIRMQRQAQAMTLRSER